MLRNAVALVTGGGSGIGRATCRALAAEGANVAVVDVNATAATETIDQIKHDGNHKSFVADVSSSTAVESLLSEVQSQLGVPNIVVNSAGIIRDDFMLRMDEKLFDQVIDVNLKGVYRVMQASSKLMVDNKIKHGSIVNLSSIVGKVGNIGQINYAASKAGVIGMTKTAAKELARYGIRCNAVLPGFIVTPMIESIPDKVIEKMKFIIPMGRTGKPEEVADTIVFLASQKSSYITGATIEVTGGVFM
ncbi:estradiol 17-beta-dehydrogenase 8-like [Tubulanus polymorphus]|uniref:estradiol 17-beta-dehydrogenase 8-like n=1 Tax=Tubulanus polymorphus TaxID=672921 RepID=UPI003DA4B4FF